MVKYGYLAKADYDSLRQLPITLDFQRVSHDEGPAPYFREVLRAELKKLLEDKDEDGNWVIPPRRTARSMTSTVMASRYTPPWILACRIRGVRRNNTSQVSYRWISKRTSSAAKEELPLLQRHQRQGPRAHHDPSGQGQRAL